MLTSILAAFFAYVAYGLVSGCIRDTGSRETENTLRPITHENLQRH